MGKAGFARLTKLLRIITGKRKTLLSELHLEEFLERLGSKEATPGGGGAAALTGANAAGLVTMVGRLTTGRPAYAAIEAQLQQVIEEGDQIRANLLRAIDADAAAFEAVMAAYGLPRATAEDKAARQIALQPALRGATESPLLIVRLCQKVVEMAAWLAEAGNPQTITDAGTAAALGYAAMQGASMQARINLKALKDHHYVKHTGTEIEQLLNDALIDQIRALTAVDQKLQ